MIKMEFSLIKKKLAKTDWYKQGVEAKYIYVGYPWIAMNELTFFGRRIPILYHTIVCHAKRNQMSWYWSKDSLLKVADFFYKKNQKSSWFIHRMLKYWREKPVNKLLKSIDKIERINFSNLSQKEFLQEFHEFSNIYMNFWRECALHDAFDVGGEIILEKAVRKEGKKITEREMHLLTIIPVLTWPQKEREEFLKIVDLARKRKSWRKEKAINEKAKKHADKYHWISNHYAGSQRLSAEYFLKDIEIYLKSPDKYYQEEEAIRHISATKKKKEKLVRKLHLTKKFLADLDFITTLAEWRDERKSYTLMADAAITKFSKEFSRRSGLDLDIVENLFWPELSKIFSSKKHFANLSKRRYQGILMLDYVRYDKGTYGRDAEELHKFLEKLIIGGEKEIKGRPAFPGIISGVARIIKSPTEFRRMRKDDILIAPNTRPEYLPIVKIAGAIVTEEGGLTCHAAIVSRELKTPCIVGVQGILSVIKDGDI